MIIRILNFFTLGKHKNALIKNIATTSFQGANRCFVLLHKNMDEQRMLKNQIIQQ